MSVQSIGSSAAGLNTAPSGAEDAVAKQAIQTQQAAAPAAAAPNAQAVALSGQASLSPANMPRLDPKLEQQIDQKNVGDVFRDVWNAITGKRTDAVKSDFNPTQQKQITQAIADQKAMLEGKKAELTRWNKDDQAKFQTSFGTATEAARQKILDCVNKELELNSKTTVDNFKPAEKGNEGVYAYVYPTDKTHTIYLGNAFWSAPAKGTDSKAGTIAHEMSHFRDIGGTKDGFPDSIYGLSGSRELARTDPAKALQHADTFEYYIEGAK